MLLGVVALRLMCVLRSQTHICRHAVSISNYCPLEREYPQFAVHDCTPRSPWTVSWIVAVAAKQPWENPIAYHKYNENVKVKVTL
jgi:hypothetical protein